MIVQWIVLALVAVSAGQRMHYWLVSNDDEPGKKAFGFWTIVLLEAIWFLLLYKSGTFSTIFSHD